MPRTMTGSTSHLKRASCQNGPTMHTGGKTGNCQQACYARARAFAFAHLCVQPPSPHTPPVNCKLRRQNGPCLHGASLLLHTATRVLRAVGTSCCQRVPWATTVPSLRTSSAVARSTLVRCLRHKQTDVHVYTDCTPVLDATHSSMRACVSRVCSERCV